MNRLDTSVVIVGGGIAGMTVAYRLQRAGVDFLLMESTPKLGGKIVTEHIGEFVIEGGPDSFMSEKPWGRLLCEELGLGDELLAANEAGRRVFMVSQRRLRPLPGSGMIRDIFDPLALARQGLLSLPGAARMALEPLLRTRQDDADESLESFMRRRFGAEFFSRVADPLLAGIYSAAASDLSLVSTFPVFRELERSHGSVLRGLGRGTGRSTFLSLRRGMRRLVDALANQINSSSLLLNARVESLKHEGDFHLRLVDGRTVTAASAVLATPALATAPMIAGMNERLAALLRQISFGSSTTITLAWRRGDVAHPLNGFGFLVPRAERHLLSACTWVSSKLPHRTPPDDVLLRCFFSGDDAANQSDQTLLSAARSELRELMSISAEPLFSRIFRWPAGMPQYRVGHRELVARIESATAEHPGLFLTGASYRGVGLPDCIRDAENVAAALVSRQVGNRHFDDKTSTRSGVGREEMKARAIAAAGRFRSGESDLGSSHDAHLAKALED